MTNKRDSTNVNLEPPGAGLPGPELIAARLLFAIQRTFRSRSGWTDMFLREYNTMLQQYELVGPGEAATAILIKRLPGLEDSSRNWSICMVLEHLAIVNDGVRNIITALTNNEIPPGKVSTADVKPSKRDSHKSVSKFIESADALSKCIECSADLNTRLRYDHPWFGSLSAAGWHAMSAFHMQLHRKQVDRILSGLRDR